MTAIQSLFFISFFPPFSASGTPRSLPHINSRKSILPNYQQELSASPQRPGMWPSVLLPHSSTYTNDGTLSHAINLQYIDYGQLNNKNHTILCSTFFLIWLGRKVGTDTSGIISLILILLRVLSTILYCPILLTYLLITLAHLSNFILCIVQTMSLFTLSNVHTLIKKKNMIG